MTVRPTLRNLLMFQFKVPAPVLGTFYEDHFDIFLQRIEEKRDGQIYGDESRPTVVASGLGKCSVCPNYRFSSKMEQDRHKTMFCHRSKSVCKEPTFAQPQVRVFFKKNIEKMRLCYHDKIIATFANQIFL